MLLGIHLDNCGAIFQQAIKRTFHGLILQSI